MSDLSTWPTKKLLHELDKARDDLKEDREWLGNQPQAIQDKDDGLLSRDRGWVNRLEEELDKRDWN